MVPPTLATNFDEVTSRGSTTTAQLADIGTGGEDPTMLGQPGTECEGDGYQIVAFTDGTRLGEWGRAAVGHSTQLGLGIAKLFGGTATPSECVDETLTSQPVADHARRAR